MATNGMNLFLCPHNAAKSVVAVTHLERLVRQRNLPYRADSTSTEQAGAPPPAVVATLRNEGIEVGTHRPRRLTIEDLARARRVVSMGCDVSGSTPPAVRVETWDDVPPVSQDFETAYAAIRRRVEPLVIELEHEDA